MIVKRSLWVSSSPMELSTIKSSYHALSDTWWTDDASTEARQGIENLKILQQVLFGELTTKTNERQTSKVDL